MANINVSLESGAVSLAIDTAKNNVVIGNQDATRGALFNVFNASVLNGQAVGSVLVWSYQQSPQTSATIPIPTTDNNGTAINWTVGNVTNPKTGVSSPTVISPPWQLTMV